MVTSVWNIMSRQIYPGILILVTLYIVPISSTDDCSTNCTLQDGKNPPEMEFKMTRITVTLKSTISLNCRLCHSNPASTIHWLFNGKALDFQGKRMHLFNHTSSCLQTLSLLTVRSEDEGNYTCVARNKFGAANSTTEITIIGKRCSSECVLTDDGQHKVGNKGLGPPKMELEENEYNVAANVKIEISCTVCQSNPPATLTWFYDGNELDANKNNIQVVSHLCREALYFRAVKNAAGNYTCIAKNALGQAHSTTMLKVYGRKLPRPKMIVSLERLSGTARGEKIKIGSRINITCVVPFSNCAQLTWSWTKDYQLITENQTGYKKENGTNQCMRKLIIDKVTASSKGDYRCQAVVWREGFPPTDVYHLISLIPVPCFKGFYCPSLFEGAKRCPNGTFTMQQNATSLEQCEPCPKKAKQNETWSTLHENHPDAANIFEINCSHYPETSSSDENPGLSRGEIAAIAVSLSALVLLVVLAILYGMRNCRNYKKLVHPPQISIEIPDVPQSKDVFVCYSSKNREWVQSTLLANLRAQHFETFIDFRDFEIGLPIHQNIVNGIYGSRKTIFVLSKDSLKSYYARTELSQALAAERQTRHRVIVILYERCKVPEEISDTVYLDWTDEEKRENFWRKLYDALRKPSANEEES